MLKKKCFLALCGVQPLGAPLPNTRLTDYNIWFNISIYGRIYNTLKKYVFESTLIKVCLILTINCINVVLVFTWVMKLYLHSEHFPHPDIIVLSLLSTSSSTHYIVYTTWLYIISRRKIYRASSNRLSIYM